MLTCGAYEAVLDGRGAIVAVGTRLSVLIGAAQSELEGRPIGRYFRGPALTAAPGQAAPLELKSEAQGHVHGLGIRCVDGDRVALTFIPEGASSAPVVRGREPESPRSGRSWARSAAAGGGGPAERAPEGLAEGGACATDTADVAIGASLFVGGRAPMGASRVVAEVVREVHDGLTGITGFAGLAQVAPTPHRRKFYLDQVATQAERVRRLVQAVDPGFGSRAPLIRPVNLGAELARALSGTRLMLERNGVAFEMVQPGHSTWASCDGRQVGDLVVALVLRATTEKRREYQANEVTISVEPAPGVVRVVMLFTGADNPALLLRETFGQGDEPHSLATSELELKAGQAALARQGGMFEIIREPELEEVRVVIALPAGPAARQRDELRTPVPLEILAIDDDAMIGELYTELLAVSGHSVTPVKSVMAARDMLRNQRFDAVVSEFQLRDGLLPELWAMASETHPELKSRLLVVTRDARDPRLIEWAGEHGTPILAKPFHATALLDQVALLSG